MIETSKQNQNRKPALGRGLGSLLGGAGQADAVKPEPGPVATETASARTAGMPQPAGQALPAEGRIWTVPVEKLKPSPYQPRKSFDRPQLEELANSIRETGILQPIVARRLPNGVLEIVAGERRWRSAQLAGLMEVPVIVKELQDKEALEMAIIENVQRADLNPIEEAEAYAKLSEDFQLTHQQVAERVGRDRVTVSNMLRLNSLPEAVKQFIRDGKIGMGHAKAILALSSPARMLEVAQLSVQQKVTVRQIEKMAKVDSEGAGAGSELTKLSPVSDREEIATRDLEKRVQAILGTKVSIQSRAGRGSVEIFFYSNEELSELTDKLLQIRGAVRA